MTNSHPYRILLVEDMPSLSQLYCEYINGADYVVKIAATAAEASLALEEFKPDGIILDLNLPDKNGLELLKEIKKSEPDMPIVMITAHGSITAAVEAMRHGAADFVVKPFTAARIRVTIANALENSRLKREVQALREVLDRDTFGNFIGASNEMQAVYRIIESVASSKASVFITGESGTGKELAAEAIHRASGRRQKPFITLNCAAIPKDLLESEIFGHVKGAFTGALTDRMGAAKAADGGTLFLDEICEMPLELQVKLLRFVQTQNVQPVGSARQEKVDVRFIAATNRDPLAEVETGRFREDLYYRLHVVPLHLPPLRERGDDVLLLARTFLQHYAADENKNPSGYSPSAEQLIQQYEWPGNVRQLQNMVHSLVVMLPPDHQGEIASELLPARLRQSLGPMPEKLRLALGQQAQGLKPLWQIEQEAILSALSATQNDVPKAASLLEISPSTIYRKLQQWRPGPGMSTPPESVLTTPAA